MEKTANQFDLKFLLAITAVAASALAGWQTWPAIRDIDSTLLWWIVLTLYMAPYAFLAGMAAIRLVRWWMCLLVGLLLPIVFIGWVKLVGNGMPIVIGFFFSDAAIVLFCLVVCIRALSRRTTITATAIAVLSSWWLGATLASM